MSNYTKVTNFASKDALPTGTPAKKILGTEIDTEYTAIAIAVNSKADAANGVHTGTAAFAALSNTGLHTNTNGRMTVVNATQTGVELHRPSAVSFMQYVNNADTDLKIGLTAGDGVVSSVLTRIVGTGAAVGAHTVLLQPRFWMSATNHLATGVVNFNFEQYDVGSVSDISTDRFTAPVTGNYILTFGGLYVNASGAANFNSSYLRKNDSTVLTTNGAGWTQYLDATVGQTSVCVTEVFPLTAGDYVELYVQLPTNWSVLSPYFRGQLIN